MSDFLTLSFIFSLLLISFIALEFVAFVCVCVCVCVRVRACVRAVLPANFLFPSITHKQCSTEMTTDPI